MVAKKDKLIDKIVKKDYNNQLEEILTNKMFTEDVKNLLLDILYKVETSYKDYTTVKVNTLSKEVYIENILKVVKNDCDNIKFMNPSIEENGKNHHRTFIVNKERKEIICYPIARKLLYSLAKIQKSDDIIKNQNQLLNITLTNMINVGNNINTVEPLRDFNGFSWNISTLEIENLYYNLIYQDLIILVGNEILEDWSNKSNCLVDYMDLFEEFLEKNYGKRISKKILELLKIISVFLELIVNKNCRNEIGQKKEKVEHEIAEMSNKEKYLEYLCKTKKEIIKKIKNIDIILNNRDLLAKEYSRRNENLPLEKKIFSIRILTKELEKEREDLLLSLQEYNDLMNSTKFLERQKKLVDEFKYLRLLDVEDIEKEVLEKIFLLQSQILKCIQIKVKNASDKIQLQRILYELRYFNLIPVEYNKKIFQIEKIQQELQDTERQVLLKAYKLKMINEIFKNEDLNVEFLENIFLLEIINLEQIYIKIYNEKEKYYIQFYDENVIDEKFEIKTDFKKEDLKIKLNKKFKLFI